MQVFMDVASALTWVLAIQILIKVKLVELVELVEFYTDGYQLDLFLCLAKDSLKYPNVTK